MSIVRFGSTLDIKKWEVAQYEIPTAFQDFKFHPFDINLNNFHRGWNSQIVEACYLKVTISNLQFLRAEVFRNILFKVCSSRFSPQADIKYCNSLFQTAQLNTTMDCISEMTIGFKSKYFGLPYARKIKSMVSDVCTNIENDIPFLQMRAHIYEHISLVWKSLIENELLNVIDVPIRQIN
ncbi:hypothetical protein BLA27_23315 [Brucella cytisi]|uniref:Uncharacterized protein n=1 Tax=Brucella cytisi TaxID=407152 RepID=A0A1J6HDF8_9HYPH|nr:hypothetical protein BLA27_23315 [Brucella cytisi]